MIKNGTKKIITDNLILRKFKEDDYQEVYENWASNKEVANNAGWPVHQKIDSTKKIVKIWVDDYKNEDTFNWIIVEKNSKQAIGSITVIAKDLNNRVCEIGYNIGQQWWNKGYGTEAIKHVINYLFSLNIFDVIIAACFEDNIASSRVLEKNHFTKEGLLRDRIIINNQKKSLLQYSIIKGEQ